MLTREQIEEIQGEAREKGIAIRERHSRAPVLLVEAEVRQGRGSGWVPTHSWRRPACRDGSDGGICRIPRKNEGCPDR
jgi:hypothetical protein